MIFLVFYLDCVAALEMLSTLSQNEKYIQLLEKEVPKNRIKMAIKKNLALWDIDHIIPVIESCGGCRLDDMRTLCAACPLKKTKKQMFIRNYGNYETLWEMRFVKK